MKSFAFALALVLQPLTAALVFAAEPVQTPYGESSVEFELHQAPDAPAYYVRGLSGVPGSENEGLTANAGFVVTDKGVVVYDALGTPALAWRLLQAIREVTDKPVTHVIAGHYHADHVYGLAVHRQPGSGPASRAATRGPVPLGGRGHLSGRTGQNL